MAFDPRLAERTRSLLIRSPGFSEKRMFGGLCFLIRGNMCCGVLGQELVLRVDADSSAALAKEKHLRPMDFTGRPLRGFFYVSPAGLRRKSQIRRWVDLSLRFARTLPSKSKATRSKNG